MTFEQLVIEFKARGFNNLGARTEQYLNDSYMLDICESEDWPFLEATKEGAAPLTIQDLAAVKYVIDTTQELKLQPLIQARITDDWTPDLSTTGTPRYYYVTKGETVNVYPLAADTLEVPYWKVPLELTGTAEPLMPKRWHSLIIDGAVSRAYENSDDWELAQAAKSRFDERLQAMKEALLYQQHDASDDHIVVTDPYALH